MEVQPGWNLVHLSGTNFYGFSGFAEASLAVNTTPENTDVELSADPYYDDTITISYTRDGTTTGPITLTQYAADPTTWSNGSSTVLGGIILVTGPNSQNNQTIHLTDDIHHLVGDVIVKLDPSTGTMKGTFVPDPEEESDYHNYSAVAGDALLGTASGPGEIEPFMIKLAGPLALKDILGDPTIDGHPYQLSTYNGGLYIRDPLRDGLLPPNEFMLTLDMTQPLNPLLGVTSTAPRRDGLGNMLKGFGRGFLDAGVSLFDGVVSMAKMGLKWAIPGYPVYRLFLDGFAPERAQAAATWNTLKPLVLLAYDLSHKTGDDLETLVESMITGDNATLNQLGEEYTVVGQVAGELLGTLKEWFVDLDDYAFGRIVGRVFGELAVLIATEGAGEIANLSKLALLEKLLPRLEKAEEFRPVVVKLQQFGESLIPALEATKEMCFVAGTPVHTVDGLKPIESIRAGDLVLSRDARSGEQAYKPVVGTFITHPSRLYHVSYALTDNQTHELACTGEHPFYLAVQEVFVPAKDLKPGDHLTLVEGQNARVISLVSEDAYNRPFTTYNFEVQDFHTYYVGEVGVWVHNAGAPCEIFARLFKRQLDKYGDTWTAVKAVLTKTAADYKLSIVAWDMGRSYIVGGAMGRDPLNYMGSTIKRRLTETFTKACADAARSTTAGIPFI